MFEAYPRGFIGSLVDDIVEAYEKAVNEDEDISHLSEDPKFVASDDTKRAFRALLDEVYELGANHGLQRVENLQRKAKAEFFFSLREYYLTFYRDGEDIIEPTKFFQIIQDAFHNYTDDNEWDANAAEWIEKHSDLFHVFFSFLHKSARSKIVASLEKIFDFGDKGKRSALEEHLEGVAPKKKKSRAEA
jgi:hypothetical protein